MLQMSVGLPSGPLKAVVRRLQDFANQQVTPQPQDQERWINTRNPDKRSVARALAEKFPEIQVEDNDLTLEQVMRSGLIQDTLMPVFGTPEGGVHGRNEEMPYSAAVGTYDYEDDAIYLREAQWEPDLLVNTLAHEFAHRTQRFNLGAAFRKLDDPPRALSSKDEVDRFWAMRQRAGGTEAQAEALGNALQAIRNYQDNLGNQRAAMSRYRRGPVDGPYDVSEGTGNEALDFWYRMLDIPRWRRDRP